MDAIALGRRSALLSMGLGLAAGASGLATAASAAKTMTLPDGANTLADLAARLAKAPRRRDFKTVPMIITSPDTWDHAALSEVLHAPRCAAKRPPREAASALVRPREPCDRMPRGDEPRHKTPSDRACGACNEDAHRLSPLSSQPACRSCAAHRPSLIQASNCALSWLTNRCPGRRLRSAPGRRAARYPTSRFHGGARSAARARSCEWLPPTDRGPRSSRQGTVTLPCEERERSTPYGFSSRRDGLAPRGHRSGA